MITGELGPGRPAEGQLPPRDRADQRQRRAARPTARPRPRCWAAATARGAPALRAQAEAADLRPRRRRAAAPEHARGARQRHPLGRGPLALPGAPDARATSSAATTTATRPSSSATAYRRPAAHRHENVTAGYRSGIGAPAWSTRGRSACSHAAARDPRRHQPAAPAGAADPEARDRRPGQRPATVLTLDRIVSLQDFEDFARAFAGSARRGRARFGTASASSFTSPSPRPTAARSAPASPRTCAPPSTRPHTGPALRSTPITHRLFGVKALVQVDRASRRGRARRGPRRCSTRSPSRPRFGQAVTTPR